MPTPSSTYLSEVPEALRLEFEHLYSQLQGWLKVKSGEWTPTLTFGNGTRGMAYGKRIGTYDRINDLVHIEWQIVLTAKGTSTGSVRIIGLPYTAANSPMVPLDGVASLQTLTGTPLAVVSGTTLALVQTTATGRTALDEGDFTNTSDLRGGLTYRTNAPL